MSTHSPINPQNSSASLLPMLMRGCVHDFNNMLTVVIGSLALVDENINSAATLKYCLNRAKSAATQAKELSEHLLKMTHAQTDVPECCDVHEVARHVSQVLIDGVLHRLDLRLPSDLNLVAIAPIELFQILGNLVLNAVEAMPQGGMVFLEAANADKQVILKITDTGPGLPGQVIKELFKPNITTKPSGHGLGLCSIRTLVEYRGGSLELSPSGQSGTSFTLTLPQAKSLQAKSNKPTRPSVPLQTPKDSGNDSGPKSAKQARVLVMDDDAWVREIAGDMLRHLGFDVEFATEGHQAVEKFRQARTTGHPFEAVILDILVPNGQSAQRTLEELKASDPRVCAILSSGQPEHELMKHYSAYGFRGCVPKPFTLTDLNRVMQSIPKN